MKRMNPGILAIILALAVALGGTIGFFLGRSTNTADYSYEGKIDYACGLTRDVDGRHESFNAPNNEEEFRDNVTDLLAISTLFGGGWVQSHDKVSELAQDLYRAVNTFDTETVDKTIDDILEYCDAR